MKKLILTLAVAGLILPPLADARGGFSSGGRSSSFSSGRSFSSPARSYSAPRSVQRSYSRPAPTYSRPQVTNNTTNHYHSNTGGGGGAGFGTGVLAGAAGMVVLDHLMHPAGTVPYSGGGYSGQGAVLYPDGKVVSNTGQQVGTYQNGQYQAVDNGAIVAQPAPTQPAPQPVIVTQTKQHNEGDEMWSGIVFGIVVSLVIAIVAGMILI